MVALKRVPDPENTAKLSLGKGGAFIDSSALPWKLNPFDELALETALRLTEDGRAPRSRVGEVIAITLGPPEAETILRSALALGATRALRVDADDAALDGLVVARALAELARAESPDLAILGKQTADGDTGQVGQQLAELLDWPCVAGCSRIVERDRVLDVRREVEGGAIELRVSLPAVIAVDLRIGAGGSVTSTHTPASHRYPDGVRFAPLPAILKAKSKPLAVSSLAGLLSTPSRLLSYTEFELPPRRAACRFASSTRELVDLLQTLPGLPGVFK